MKSTTAEFVRFGDPFTEPFPRLKTAPISPLHKMPLSQARKVVSGADALSGFRGMVEVYIRVQETTGDCRLDTFVL